MNFGTIGGIVTSVVFGGGAALALVRLNMRGAFTSLSAHHQLADRVDAVEQRMAQMPSHTDLAVLSGRLAAVERAVGVVDAKLSGVTDAVRRVEHTLDLLLKTQLDTEARTR